MVIFGLRFPGRKTDALLNELFRRGSGGKLRRPCLKCNHFFTMAATNIIRHERGARGKAVGLESW